MPRHDPDSLARLAHELRTSLTHAHLLAHLIARRSSGLPEDDRRRRETAERLMQTLREAAAHLDRFLDEGAARPDR